VTKITVDPGQLYDQFVTGATQNYGSYSNPQVDDLLKKAKQELDTGKQKALYTQVRAIIMDEVPFHFA
jgi:ABC-type transport system substrate-binding protein